MRDRNGKAVGFIFVRGGSKGVPRKNLRPIGGRPLLEWSIRAAKAVSRISRVIVSTDDSELAEMAKRLGAEVPFMRPAELARDDSPEWLAWQHAVSRIMEVDGGAFDLFVSLPVTSPLRRLSDVDRCIESFFSAPEADIVITGTASRRSPYFNMARIAEGGLAELAARGEKVFRRQDAPKLYDLTTVAYVTSPAHIMRSSGVFDGRVKLVEVDEISAIDIDTEFDLMVADMVAQKVGERS